MRAYEFAKKVGATYAAVVKLAEANDVEVYSPLTQFEPDEVEALHAAFLKADRASLQAEAAQVAEKRRSKAVKALTARVAHDRQQFDELEAGRKRALEAAGLKPMRDDDRPQRNLEKRIRAKQRRTEARKKQSKDDGSNG